MPVETLVQQLQIISVVQLCQRRAKLHPCQADRIQPLSGFWGESTYLRPIQPRDPKEKGWVASSTSAFSASSHLSGLKTNGSEKLEELRLAAIGLVDTTVYGKRQLAAICTEFHERLTPPGSKWPSTVSPPLGTTLGRANGRGGYMRKPSSTTALRYFSGAVEVASISLYDLKPSRISF